MLFRSFESRADRFSAREALRLGTRGGAAMLARDDIADIMVNGDKPIFVGIDGKVVRTNLSFRDQGQLLNVCQRIASQAGRRVDESSPICDARLPDGSRVNVVLPPIAVDGPLITIRRFGSAPLGFDDLRARGAIPPELADRVQGLVRDRRNLLISGGTATGKTTLLSALTGLLDERLPFMVWLARR